MNTKTPRRGSRRRKGILLVDGPSPNRLPQVEEGFLLLACG